MKLAFAGGGTGGHLAPAVAILEELRAREDNSPALILTAGHATSAMGNFIDGSRTVHIPAVAVSPRKLWLIPRSILINYRGYKKSLKELRINRPDLMVGLGGYVSVPSVLAAHKLRIPVVLHEQNRIMGRANRFLVRFAVMVIGGYPLRKLKNGEKVRDGIGFPIRRLAMEKAPPGMRLTWGLKSDKFTIMVSGGSRGARSINLLIEKIIPLLIKRENTIQFIHLTGENDFGRITAAYRKSGITAAVFPSLKNIGWCYSLSDLVIGRSGGSTLSELTYWKLPSILIPYPWAVDDHQLENARYFESVGAALVYKQADLSDEQLYTDIMRLEKNRDELKRMSNSAGELYKPGAAGKIIDLFLKAAKCTESFSE